MEVLANTFNQMTEDLVDYIENLAAAKMHNQEIGHLMDLQHGYYENLTVQLNVTHRLLHDFRQFRTLMYGAIKENSFEKVKNYLEKTDPVYKDMSLPIYCENMEVNAIVSYAAENCRKHEVEFEHMVQLTESVSGISIYDLCIIIGNLLDNAAEAAAKCPYENRWVKLYVTIYKANLMVRTENSHAGEVNEVDGCMVSSKGDGHGLGISIVEMILERYEGDFILEYDKNQFNAKVLLPYNPAC